ncbi:MAG: DUF389 domain-containing protein [Arenimonas sp.]
MSLRSFSSELSHSALTRPIRFVWLQWRRLSRSVDHDAVVREVNREGSMRSSYLFMSAMASGIATTGLLVGSPAVIIGAMLISPLMAPIVRLGLSVATLEHVRARDAAAVLGAGSVVALLTAVAIVAASPIQEITAEIAARTRPSLFDLVVAVLSGLAGGYAMVRGRGGAIVGVAIATALMPPLAVVGFGIAAAKREIAEGAGLLFLTNLVAIALSVTAVATWYGFSRRRVRRAIAWQTLLGFLLVLPLAIPLLHSLGDISREAQASQAVRAAVAQVFGADESRILGLQARVNGADAYIVDLAFAARRYTRADDLRLKETIRARLGSHVELHLSPIVEANPERARALDAAVADVSRLRRLPRTTPVPADHALLAAFPFPIVSREIDPSGHHMRLQLGGTAPDLKGCRDMESALARKSGGWTIVLVPPVQGLPQVRFDEGRSTLDADATRTLELIAWVLSRWNSPPVQVVGHASSNGRNNAQLALRRAQAVADWLTAEGVQARALGAGATRAQALEEKRRGRDAFMVADVLLEVREPAHSAPSAAAADPPP